MGIGSVRNVRHLAWIAIIASVLVVGCGGAPETARANRVFYDWAVATGSGGGQYEEPYPPLDLAGLPPAISYRGVTVLRGGVHLSRPVNWSLRDGDNTPGQAFVQYVSPNAYLFSLYERPESPRELWRDVMRRFEDDVRSVGARIAGGRVPIGTLGAQGRAYTVERQVEAGKVPLTSRSREYLLRGPSRIVLAQIVYEGEDLSAHDQELLRVIATLEVL